MNVSVHCDGSLYSLESSNLGGVEDAKNVRNIQREREENVRYQER